MHQSNFLQVVRPRVLNKLDYGVSCLSDVTLFLKITWTDDSGIHVHLSSFV